MTSDDRSAAFKRQRAYRDANRHVVSAGILLATMGVPKDAPELLALRAALRAINTAGGIETPKAPDAKPTAAEGAPVRKEGIRVFPTREGTRFGRTDTSA